MDFEVRIDKLVHGGQGLGTLEDGQKIFVWNALPGELVRGRIIKKKKSYLEGIAQEIVEASPDRVAPLEDNYLATSPWQVLNLEAENRFKGEIVQELMDRETVKVPAFDVQQAGPEYGYRNKMEYSFWGDDDGLHLALHTRGSHQKQIVQGSALALPALDTAAKAVITELQKLNPRAGDLKTVIVRVSQTGEAVASLFVKLEKFSKLTLPPSLKGLRVYYSNPKSPASVPTKLLAEYGDATLTDSLLGKEFQYDVDSFFQVNIPIFETALTAMKAHVTEPEIIDMYAGVGSIGLSLATNKVDLIELDPATAAMARKNAKVAGINVDVIEAPTEKALEYIVPELPVVFDPPRAGLHDKVVERVLEVLPPKILYLSCNPATQARDLAKLQTAYEIVYFEVFNFFPRTPHIESLAVLRRRIDDVV